LAGYPGHGGSHDGMGSAAQFGNPSYGSSLSGVAVESSGNVYVADTINSTIRKVTPAGLVTTLAGQAPAPSVDPWSTVGYADGVGSAARFNFPRGVAVDGAGNVYVADSGNSTVRKVAPDRVVTTLAGTAGAIGSADGAGSAARFNFPCGVAVDGAGNVYVADTGNNAIRKVTPVGPNWVVTTVAGVARVVAGADGIGSLAQFSFPYSVALDSLGNVYVADAGNNRITKGSLITVPAPRFGTASASSHALSATLSELVLGTTVILESSANLRDWLPVQTNVVGSSSLPVRVDIDPAMHAQFMRALVK